MFTFRNIVHWVTMALLGALVGGFVALVVATEQADGATGIPIVHCRVVPGASCFAIDHVTGSRAQGFTVTLAGGGSFTTGSLHEELRQAEGRKGRAMVRAAMREYVSVRNAC